MSAESLKNTQQQEAVLPPTSNSTPPDLEYNSDFISTDEEDDTDSLQDDPNSMATQFTQSIYKELRDGLYTCLVCTGEIDAFSKVWSCDECHRVFDLDCIKDWAKRGSSTMADKSWKCPSCNSRHHKLPKQYTCWCGKVINPQINEFEPHSCGQTCNSPLDECVHGCSFACHPGPHVKKCTAVGPVMSCNCGEKTRQLPCIITPYGTGWSCGKICNDILPCGIHRCNNHCHTGLCGDCEETIEARCYCGKHTENIDCHERLPRKSKEGDKVWFGAFQCDEECGDSLDCGNHTCHMLCHPKSSSSHRCPLGPSMLTHCPCGKFLITELTGKPRESCLDPIPTCENICGKTLACGHKCYWKCHEGECAPCYATVDIKCKCNYSQFSIACSLNQEGYVPSCQHKCQALLSCRRHRCLNICCQDEQTAVVRERDRQKSIRRHLITRTADDTMSIEASHICTRECGKLLSCGKHYCKMTCHFGPCSPCLESSSDDLVCHCGKTVVPAPVRCGTKLPVCLNQCQRPTKCGHRAEMHNCHPDDKECPRCTVLVSKLCQCEKQVLVPKVMCYQDKVSCGKYCGNLLPCGAHRCNRICHRPGDCVIKCAQPCGKKRLCGHDCKQTCHAPFRCNEAILCSELVTIYCDCKKKSKQIVCSLIKPESRVECDAECARVQRNKRLFEAFHLGTSKSEESLLSNDYVVEMKTVEVTYTTFILSLYSQQKSWCTSVEKIFLDLMSGSLGRESHHFSPMKQIQRKFIHEMAIAYGMFAESQDQPPKRSVFIKLETKSRVPQFKLDEALFISEKNKEREKLQNERAKLIEESKFKGQEELFNAIAIKDLFFGVTRDELENALTDIWDTPAYSNVTKPTIQWVSDNTFVFYPERFNLKTRKLESELNSLIKLFENRLKEKNLAYTCMLAKIDETATVIYEIKKPIDPEALAARYEQEDAEELKRKVESETPYFGYGEDVDKEIVETVIDPNTFDWY